MATARDKWAREIVLAVYYSLNTLIMSPAYFRRRKTNRSSSKFGLAGLDSGFPARACLG